MGGGLDDLFGGGGGTATPAFPQAQPVGGGMDMLFGGGAPSFPSYIVYEDAIISIGLDFRRENQNTHIITAHYKNKLQCSISGVNMQVAAQKYMALKMQPASGTSLAAGAQDLT